MSARRLRHGRIELVLHALRVGGEPPLLALHPLGASSTYWRARLSDWPGAIHALDFGGHGASGWRNAAIYTPELFAADADIALAALGRARVVGAGVGAYAALLLASARPDQVEAALLLPGAGLEGGGAEPALATSAKAFESFLADMKAATASLATRGLDPERAGEPDPWTRVSATDPRPPEYAREHAAHARRILLAEDGTARPPWWTTLRGLACAESVSPRDAIGALSGSGSICTAKRLRS